MTALDLFILSAMSFCPRVLRVENLPRDFGLNTNNKQLRCFDLTKISSTIKKAKTSGIVNETDKTMNYG